MTKEERNLCDACKTCENRTRSWVICLEECGHVIDALEHVESERAVSQPACEDAISRKAVLDIWHTSYSDNREENDEIQYKKIAFELPPVTPTQKMGEWIETGYALWDGNGNMLYECMCNECNGLAYFRKESLKHTLVGAKCCPYCGAKMKGAE